LRIFIIFCLILSNIYALGAIKTFNSDFIQSVKNPSGSKVEYTGNIVIDTDSKVAWFYKTPVEKNIYILNKAVTIIEPQIEQVIFTKHNIQIDLFSIIEKASTKKENFTHKVDSQNYNIKVAKSGDITGIEYLDEFENNVTITFTNTHYNKKINQDIFEFTIPSSYDILYK